jgi:hypothetical protein
MKNSGHSSLHTLKDTWHLGARGIRARGLLRPLRAAGETETTQENIQDWLQLDEGDPGFQLLTEEEIKVKVVALRTEYTVHEKYMNAP